MHAEVALQHIFPKLNISPQGLIQFSRNVFVRVLDKQSHFL